MSPPRKNIETLCLVTKPYENYMPIGQAEHCVIYCTNEKEYKKKSICHENLRYKMFKVLSLFAEEMNIS